MKIEFYKYQGTGNDFIIIDNRKEQFNSFKKNEFIAGLCHRKFGIGADGFILLETDSNTDFKMVYYNSDGNESSMCGNGGRCIAAFAEKLGLIVSNGTFSAIDGIHEVLITKRSENGKSLVKLKMIDVDEIENISNHLFLNTGSPHYIIFDENTEKLDLEIEGRKIRYNERFSKAGTNVNFVKKKQDGIYLRTYERGVEAETLSCGTGATAAALASVYAGITENNGKCKVVTPGGILSIYYSKKENEEGFEDVWLEGYAELVFTGEIIL